MNMITTTNLRRLAMEQGINSVPDLARRVKAVDPQGKGVTANALKRFWWNDGSLHSYNRNALELICEALSVEPGDILQLALTEPN